MDNQQVTQTRLAWLAGMWDADGHFSIRRTVLKSKTPQYSPRIGLTNSNPAMLTEARKILDELGVSYYFREKGYGAFDGSKKQVWVVSVETMTNAVILITAIQPYLVGKIFQAECILEFCRNRIAKCGTRKGRSNAKRQYTERDFQLVHSVFEANGDIRGTSETIVQDAQRAKI